MAFTRISDDQSSRTETYCDGEHHVTIVSAAHPFSGVPAGVWLADCDGAHLHKDEAIAATDTANAKVEGEDVQPPATHEEFEKL